MSKHRGDVESLESQIIRLPQAPGVYLFKSINQEILYIGKAKRLKARALQYIRGQDGREMVDRLLKKAVFIEVTLTETEKQALILEAQLISKYQPQFNVRLREGVRYMHLLLDRNKEWPQLTLVRQLSQLKQNQLKETFGPLPSARAARETLAFVQRSFSLRTCSDHEFKRRKRPCLEFQMHRCAAPCVQKCSEADYQKIVDQVRLFLMGRNADVVRHAEKQMLLYAQQERFELAAKQRDLIFALKETIEKQSVMDVSRMDSDTWGWFRSEGLGFVSILPFRAGHMMEAVHIPFFETVQESDGDLLSSLLNSWYAQAHQIPAELIVHKEPAGKDLLEEVLSERAGHSVSIKIPKRGARKKLVDLALMNAQSAYSRQHSQEQKRTEVLRQLQDILHILAVWT